VEACLGRIADRGPLLLTLGAAGATVLVMLAVVGIPAVDACRGDARGLLGCLRGKVSERFDLGPSTPASVPVVVPPDAPGVAAGPVVAAPAPPVQPTETPVVQSGPEPARSLTPAAIDKPTSPVTAPPPQVVAEPSIAASPEPPAPPVVEIPDAVQPQPIPAPEAPSPAEAVAPDAPSIAPPLPAVAVEDAPPDQQVAAALPDPVPPAEPAPDLSLPAAPDLPTPPSADPAIAAEPAVPEPLEAEPALAETPVAEPPVDATSVAPELPPPQAADPLPEAQPAEAPAPAVAAPTPPDLPATPPPDLAVAAVDPVVPDDPPQVASPVLAPTIDAVEIHGGGDVIAGDGPAGATMRLYVDGLPAGVSLVEAGRWRVEGADLLTEPGQTLKVEALDAITGKVIGEATVEFEPPTQPAAAASPPVDGPVAAPVAPVEAPVTTEPGKPVPVPAIEPVVPVGEGSSVTILRPSVGPQITTLATGEPSAGAVVNLGAPPDVPATPKPLTLPDAAAGPGIVVLRAGPIGESRVGGPECDDRLPLVDAD